MSPREKSCPKLSTTTICAAGERRNVCCGGLTATPALACDVTRLPRACIPNCNRTVIVSAAAIPIGLRYRPRRTGTSGTSAPERQTSTTGVNDWTYKSDGAPEGGAGGGRSANLTIGAGFGAGTGKAGVEAGGGVGAGGIEGLGISVAVGATVGDGEADAAGVDVGFGVGLGVGVGTGLGRTIGVGLGSAKSSIWTSPIGGTVSMTGRHASFS